MVSPSDSASLTPDHRPPPTAHGAATRALRRRQAAETAKAAHPGETCPHWTIASGPGGLGQSFSHKDKETSSSEPQQSLETPSPLLRCCVEGWPLYLGDFFALSINASWRPPTRRRRQETPTVSFKHFFCQHCIAFFLQCSCLPLGVLTSRDSFSDQRPQHRDTLFCALPPIAIDIASAWHPRTAPERHHHGQECPR